MSLWLTIMVFSLCDYIPNFINLELYTASDVRVVFSVETFVLWIMKNVVMDIVMYNDFRKPKMMQKLTNSNSSMSSTPWCHNTQLFKECRIAWTTILISHSIGHT